MTYRSDTDEKSTVQIPVRFTRTVWDRIGGLARYCKENPSQLMRRLVEQKRRALIDAGKRPLLKAPEDADWSGFQRAAAASGDSERASVRRIIYMTPTERDRTEGLAWYLEMRVSELIRQLESEERQRLYDEGKRPPLRPNVNELVLEDSGPKTPRKKR